MIQSNSPPVPFFSTFQETVTINTATAGVKSLYETADPGLTLDAMKHRNQRKHQDGWR